jgi:hypothetical protein
MSTRIVPDRVRKFSFVRAPWLQCEPYLLGLVKCLRAQVAQLQRAVEKREADKRRYLREAEQRLQRAKDAEAERDTLRLVLSEIAAQHVHAPQCGRIGLPCVARCPVERARMALAGVPRG